MVWGQGPLRLRAARARKSRTPTGNGYIAYVPLTVNRRNRSKSPYFVLVGIGRECDGTG